MNELVRSNELFDRARAVIPGGIPGIRSPENFVPGAYPILLEKGAGGQIVDVDGNEYVDLLLGYGPIILGHGEASVDRAAADSARQTEPRLWSPIPPGSSGTPDARAQSSAPNG